MKEAKHIGKAVSGAFTLDADSYLLLSEEGPTTVVLAVAGTNLDLVPQVSLDGNEWHGVTGRRVGTQEPCRVITQNGACIFDCTGWLYFSVNIRGGTVTKLIANRAYASGQMVNMSAVESAVIGETYVTETTAVALTTRVDDANATTTYIGKAPPGTAPTAATWQIARLVVSGVVTTIAFADGNAAFDNIWDNRASLTYS